MATSNTDAELVDEQTYRDEFHAAPRSKGDGFGHRLYSGESGFKFVENRRRWYAFSLFLVVASIALVLFRGLNFGIDFVGGNTFEVPTAASNLSAAETIVQDGLDEYTAAQEEAADNPEDVRTGEIATSQIVGSGSGESILIKTTAVDQPTATKIGAALASEFGVEPAQVSSQSIDPSWGSNISNKAITALLVFLVAVSVFLRFRYKPRMVVGAIVALIHDLVVTIGVYAAIGFEVSPATVIGLLTILGFSLYDTVVVFDKVDENTKDLLAGSRMTYGEATNLAINQTLMRSINTSLISLLPVAGLLFVGAGLLGAGTLKDLSLVLFAGIVAGVYSSIFLAAPITVDFAERRPEYIEQKRKVEARRKAGKSPVTGKTATGKSATKSATKSVSKSATKAQARTAAKAPGKKAAVKKAPATVVLEDPAPAEDTAPADDTSVNDLDGQGESPSEPDETAEVTSEDKPARTADKPRPGARPSNARTRKRR